MHPPQKRPWRPSTTAWSNHKDTKVTTQDFRLPRLSTPKTSDSQDFRLPRLPTPKTSDSQDFRLSRLPTLQTSDSPDFRLSRLSTVLPPDGTVSVSHVRVVLSC